MIPIVTLRQSKTNIFVFPCKKKQANYHSNSDYAFNVVIEARNA